ncbi:MAG: alginate lyase family protein [bacterium]
MNLNKLRTMSLGEVHYRLKMASAKSVRTLLREKYRDLMSHERYLQKWRLGSDFAASFSEATGQAQWATAEELLLQHMRARFAGARAPLRSPRFFVDHDQRPGIITLAQERRSHNEDFWAEAERSCGRRFAYLNIEAEFPDGIDWHLDPISRRRWPQRFYTEIKFYGQRNGAQELPGDVKYVWELNRHHHFTVLGKAYWLSGDEKYAAELLAQCEGWIDQNPYLWGINWTSALEAGMRAWSWLWAYFFCLYSESMTPALHARLLRMLQLHARYLGRHLSFYTSPYNHLVGESAALFALGLLFPEFPESMRWRQRGWKILIEEVVKQFHADGGSVEQAMSYHHFTLGLYLQAVILAQRNDVTVPVHLRERLERALEFCMHSQQPDGRHPMIGDNDNAFAFYFGGKKDWDFREYLALGAVLFQRGDFKALAGEYHEACLWLLGPESRSQFDLLVAKKPERSTLLLADSGYAVLRSARQREGHSLVFDCGPQSHGLFADENVSTAHGHADALSFNLCAHGVPFLIDAGMLTYNGDLRWQNYFRSGAAHNVLTVNGQSACRVVGRLGYSHVPAVEQSAFIQQEGLVFVEAHVTGFGSNVRHRRGILYRSGEYWLILDSLEGEGEHLLECWLHFAPGLRVQGSNGQIIAQYSDHQKLLVRDLRMPAAQCEVYCGGEEPELGWVAPAYGCKIAAPVVRLRAQKQLPAQFMMLVMPFTASPPPVVCELTGHYGAHGALPFTVRLQGESWEDQFTLERKAEGMKVSWSRR